MAPPGQPSQLGKRPGDSEAEKRAWAERKARKDDERIAQAGSSITQPSVRDGVNGTAGTSGSAREKEGTPMRGMVVQDDDQEDARFQAESSEDEPLLLRQRRLSNSMAPEDQGSEDTEPLAQQLSRSQSSIDGASTSRPQPPILSLPFSKTFHHSRTSSSETPRPFGGAPVASTSSQSRSFAPPTSKKTSSAPSNSRPSSVHVPSCPPTATSATSRKNTTTSSRQDSGQHGHHSTSSKGAPSRPPTASSAGAGPKSTTSSHTNKGTSVSAHYPMRLTTEGAADDVKFDKNLGFQYSFPPRSFSSSGKGKKPAATSAVVHDLVDANAFLEFALTRGLLGHWDSIGVEHKQETAGRSEWEVSVSLRRYRDDPEPLLVTVKAAARRGIEDRTPQDAEFGAKLMLIRVLVAPFAQSIYFKFAERVNPRLLEEGNRNGMLGKQLFALFRATFPVNELEKVETSLKSADMEFVGCQNKVLVALRSGMVYEEDTDAVREGFGRWVGKVRDLLIKCLSYIQFFAYRKPQYADTALWHIKAILQLAMDSRGGEPIEVEIAKWLAKVERNYEEFKAKGESAPKLMPHDTAAIAATMRPPRELPAKVAVTILLDDGSSFTSSSTSVLRPSGPSPSSKRSSVEPDSRPSPSKKLREPSPLPNATVEPAPLSPSPGRPISPLPPVEEEEQPSYVDEHQHSTFAPTFTHFPDRIPEEEEGMRHKYPTPQLSMDEEWREEESDAVDLGVEIFEVKQTLVEPQLWDKRLITWEFELPDGAEVQLKKPLEYAGLSKDELPTRVIILLRRPAEDEHMWPEASLKINTAFAAISRMGSTILRKHVKDISSDCLSGQNKLTFARPKVVSFPSDLMVTTQHIVCYSLEWAHHFVDSQVGDDRTFELYDTRAKLGNQQISLIDPTSRRRMEYPVRGMMDCEHLEAFDLATYLKANRNGGPWDCPICGNFAPLESLAKCDWTIDALQSSFDSINVE